MTMDFNGNESGIAFKAETGELYMLGKMERILLRAILTVTLKSGAGRDLIIHKHGKEALQIAERLLEEMGGALDES
jgi:hypothetical protein